MLDIGGFLLVTAVLLVVSALIHPLAQHLRLPPNVLLAGVGVAIGAAAWLALNAAPTDGIEEMARPFAELPVRSTVFLFVFLPPLLFQASLTIDVRRMAEDAAPILLLAVIAVVVATGVVGWALAALSGMSLLACLLLGSIVATTDPAAVVGIFRDIGAPARLTRLVEGESLLNDAAAISLFSLLLGMLTGSGSSWSGAFTHFLISFGGGIALGLVMGRIWLALVPLLRNIAAAEFSLSLALPYLAFIVGEHFHISGVVAVVAAGLVAAAGGPGRVLPANWAHLQRTWEQIASLLGSLVFVLAAVLVPRLFQDVGLRDLVLILALVAAALAARAIVLFGLLPLLSAAKLAEKVEDSYKTVIVWGGLRGAVTLALAMAITENAQLSPDIKRFVAVLSTGFVLFTLFVNGTTLRSLIRLLGLDKLSPMQLALRNQVLALALADVKDAVAVAGKKYGVAPPTVRAVTKGYQDRIGDLGPAAGKALGEVDQPLTDRELLTVSLVALANRERELILEHHGRRTVPIAVVERMLGHASRLLDGARTDGRLGYAKAGKKSLRFTAGFRFSHRLYRHLKVERLLSAQLAERFAMLLVYRLVLDELKRWAVQRLKPMLGERIAGIAADIVDQRVTAVGKNLDALRLQYPDYADALERRFLRAYALRHEAMQYEMLHAEGLLGEELHEHLHRSISAHPQDGDEPKLDLGLNTLELLRQVSLFAGLSDSQLAEVTRVFRPMLAVPDEVIVRRGERGDAAYFISSGAVEVKLPDNRVRLGRGDVFGEMALIDRAPRMADVVSLTYCTLLVLDKDAFHAFLARHPDIRVHIEDVIRTRRGTTAEAEG